MGRCAKRRLLCTLSTAFVLSLAGVSHAQDGDGAVAFARLKALVGEWNGTVQWTGVRTDSGTMTVTYATTGGGSAVVENLGDAAAPSMTSVYHLDGRDLRLTHYCGAQNQPRLKASHLDTARGAFDFAFVDITNLRSPDAFHVHGVELRLIDEDHMTLTFLVTGGGGESRELITLTRSSRS